MIRSMTAYANTESSGPLGVLSCEIRSVNHRYLELGLRLPEELRPLESVLRERVAQKVSRGKVDLSFRFKPAAAGAAQIQLDEAVLAQYAALSHRLHAAFPGMGNSFADILRLPGVRTPTAMNCSPWPRTGWKRRSRNSLPPAAVKAASWRRP